MPLRRRVVLGLVPDQDEKALARMMALNGSED
jgi:hypothetical protein